MGVIEVYADIWCPFSYVGLQSARRRRTELGRDDVLLRVRAWPLELVNQAPLDPDETAAHIADLRETVVPDLFNGFDTRSFPRTTLPALALVVAAYRQGNKTGEAVSLELRRALFEEGSDISRLDVLSDIAKAYGLSAASAEDEKGVLREWHDGQKRGVKGSPHFFCGELESFCPSLVITKDAEDQLHIRRDTEALDAFIAACFQER